MDIETTGSHAGGCRMTEIAILIHNGKKVIEEYQTLINPEQPIPYAIQVLTGIRTDMLENAPSFQDIAEDVYHLLQGKVFVAHNVNFDYSFLIKELKQAGYDWQAPKLCTVRLSRKIIPGYTSYSLGNLCRQVGIEITDRHRAMGDARATAQLFDLLLKKDTENYLFESVKKNREHKLPSHIAAAQFEKLPEITGIYIFRNAKNKILYVGKAVNIKKRVLSHFTGNNDSLRRQQFINEVCHIDFEATGTELMALLTECQLIKKHWPIHNRALKKYEAKFALIHYQDVRGYDRLAVSKMNPNAPAVHYFETVTEANLFLGKLMQEFDLPPALCTFYSPSTQSKEDRQVTCGELPSIENHATTIARLFDHLECQQHSFLLIDKGRHEKEQSYIYVKKGKLYAFGFVDQIQEWREVEDIVSYKDKCISNFYMQQLVQEYAKRYPEKVYPLK